jgi:dUTP pyrophosphatase
LSPRSSTFKTWGIIQTNSSGKIDNSYSGDEDEWGMPVYALKDGIIENLIVVCQFEIMKKMPKVKIQ